MRTKSKVIPKLIMLLFAVTAIVVGNQILNASGIFSMLFFLIGFFLIFLGTWRLFSHKTKKVWLNGLLFLFVGLIIMFLSIWLPAILYIL